MTYKTASLLKKAQLQANLTSLEQSSVASAKRDFSNSEKAEIAFKKLREKLLRIENWNDAAGASNYALFDVNGSCQIGKLIAANDFIRVALKGAIKFDWVRIIEIYCAPNETVLTVCPSFDPTEKKIEENVVSHFFNKQATNNFCLGVTGATVNFYVIGLSEMTNVAETKSYLESVRNLVTTNLGFFLGIQQAEWKTFCERFLEYED